MVITTQFVATHHPEIAEALKAIGKSEGAASERKRILGLDALALPGLEQTIAMMKRDGFTTPEQAALKLISMQSTYHH